MTTEDTNIPSESTEVTGPTLEELQTQVAELQAEAAKQKNIRKTVEQERNDWKKKAQVTKPEPQSEEYKSLWEAERAEKEQLVTRVKSTAIDSALLAKLTKVGVLPDALDAARKLVDKNIIEWDPEAGVDGTSVDAAIQVMKKDYGFMFEKKVNRTTPKLPADSSSNQTGKTINREEFERLPQHERRAAIKNRVEIVD